MKIAISKINLAKILIPLGLFCLIFVVYYPSLAHIHRSDQWAYLIDTVNNNGFIDNAIHTYSYNRTRVVYPGDVALFRPILFLLLSFEKSVFGTNLSAWQLMAIFLHSLATYLIFILMNNFLAYYTSIYGNPDLFLQIKSRKIDLFSLIPLALALFFAVNFAIQETVIWTHINAYILFLVFVCGAIISSFKIISNHQIDLKKKQTFLTLSWLLTLMSAFTYEIGQLFAILVGTFLAIGIPQQTLKKRLGYFLSFSFIGVFYQIINRIDLVLHQGKYVEDINPESVADKIFQVDSIKHFIRFFNYVVIQPFFPSIGKASFNGSMLGQRINIAEPLISNSDNIIVLMISAVTLGLLIIITCLAMQNFISEKNKVNPLSLSLFILVNTFFLYAGIIIFGRMNIRPGANILSTNSYYTYISLALLLPLVFLLFIASTSRLNLAKKKFYKFAILVFLMCSTSLSIYSGVKVYKLNKYIAEEVSIVRSSIDKINTFIASQKLSSRTLAFDISDSKNVVSIGGIPMNTILFRQYENNFNPKYILKTEKDLLIEQNLEDYKMLHPNQKYQLFPDFIEPHSFYNIFYYNNYYWAVMTWDGYYDPARKDHFNLVRDTNLAGAIAQAQEKLLEYAEEIRKALDGVDKTKEQEFFQQVDYIKQGRATVFGLGTVLLEEGYKPFNIPFNILLEGKNVYGIAQGESFTKNDRNKKSNRYFMGSSVAEVKQMIAQTPNYVPYGSNPSLVEQSYQGFNIVAYQGKLYAFAQSLGSVDFSRLEQGVLKDCQSRKMCFIGSSLEEVKRQVSEIINTQESKTNSQEPKLVEEGYKSFNIVSYKNKFYGIAQSLGSVDFSRLEQGVLKDCQSRKMCFIGSSLEEVKRQVPEIINTQESKTSSQEPKLVEEGYKNFNIVSYKNKFYGVAQRLGSIDFSKEEQKIFKECQLNNTCFIRSSIAEVKQEIDKLK